MYTLFDTETTGLSGDARIAQIGAVLLDKDFNIRGEIMVHIQPDGWTMPDSTAAFHGISHNDCVQYGLPIASALNCLKKMADVSRYVGGHNYTYDYGRVSYECQQMPVTNFLDRKESLCTMQLGTDICKLSGKYPGKFKWPKLQELHKFLFGEEFIDAHDALADVKATAKCLKEISIKFPHALRR